MSEKNAINTRSQRCRDFGPLTVKRIPGCLRRRKIAGRQGVYVRLIYLAFKSSWREISVWAGAGITCRFPTCLLKTYHEPETLFLVLYKTPIQPVGRTIFKCQGLRMRTQDLESIMKNLHQIIQLRYGILWQLLNNGNEILHLCAVSHQHYCLKELLF